MGDLRADRLGAHRRAPASSAGGGLWGQDRAGGGGRDPRQRRAPGARVHPGLERRGVPRRVPSWTTTATASPTSPSAPPSPRRAIRSPSTSSDSHDQVIGFVNSSFPNTMSAVHMALAFLIDPRTPKNDGTFRPVKVIARQGTIVWPYPPPGHPRHQPLRSGDRGGDHQGAGAGVYGSRHRRLGAALPHRHQGRQPPHASGSSSGTSFTRARGGGASPVGDGWEAAGEGQAAGGIKFGSVEVAEARFPLFFERHEFRPDTAGDGRYRGGVGVDRPCAWRSPSPPWATRPATAFAIRRTASSAVRTVRPHRYRLHGPRDASAS